ncbi:hypothetical protein [Neorhizobium alkalisoli]|uniref:hypothetical protein n=1 Tax=Neorhizobium alkalisoli TaxID=528178 RepID=UPI000CF974EC|nr:hypothetical protein [Neorhizobium alkalisoli]
MADHQPDEPAKLETRANTAQQLSLIEISFPEKITPFVWLAMAMGLVLVAGALIGHIGNWRLQATGSLLLSAGIAIILAAFGGQATLRGKVFILAGVAALAVVLTWFLEHQRSSDIQRDIDTIAARGKDYARGYVRDVPAPPTKVSLVFGESVIVSTTISRPDLFSFAVFGDQTKEVEYASLRLEPPDEETAPLVTIGIPVSCIELGMGASRPLDWSVRKAGETWEVIDQRQSERVVGRWGGRRADPCAPQVASGGRGLSFTGLLSVVSNAFAQQSSPNQMSAHVDLAKTGADLKSDVTEVRRAARNTLSSARPEQVPAIVELLNADPDVYRTKLGVAVALTEMLRRNKEQGPIISPLLSSENRNALLDLAGDPDRTVRIYATEFLFDLGDPEVTKLAIARAASTQNNDARYNWVLAAQDGWRRLDPVAKQALKTDLDAAYEQSGERTKQLFEAFRN